MLDIVTRRYYTGAVMMMESTMADALQILEIPNPLGYLLARNADDDAWILCLRLSDGSIKNLSVDGPRLNPSAVLRDGAGDPMAFLQAAIAGQTHRCLVTANDGDVYEFVRQGSSLYLAHPSGRRERVTSYRDAIWRLGECTEGSVPFGPAAFTRAWTRGVPAVFPGLAAGNL